MTSQKKDNFTNENEEDIKKIRVQEILSTKKLEIKKIAQKDLGNWCNKIFVIVVYFVVVVIDIVVVVVNVVALFVVADHIIFSCGQ